MPYRTRRTRRGTSYRRPKRRLLWIRDWIHIATDLNDTNYWEVDLLWKARTGDGASNGQVLEMVSSPRAPITIPLMPQDYAGATVRRIVGKGQMLTAATTQSGSLAKTAVIVAPLSTLSVHTGDATDIQSLWDQKGVVSEDYLHYNAHYSTDMNTRSAESTTPPGTIWALGADFDSRCMRKLQDWGDSLKMRVQGYPGVTINDVMIDWSVLLQLP